eukprot:6840987-Prymnesium_polylepis.1
MPAVAMGARPTSANGARAVDREWGMRMDGEAGVALAGSRGCGAKVRGEGAGRGRGNCRRTVDGLTPCGRCGGEVKRRWSTAPHARAFLHAGLEIRNGGGCLRASALFSAAQSMCGPIWQMHLVIGRHGLWPEVRRTEVP